MHANLEPEHSVSCCPQLGTIWRRGEEKKLCSSPCLQRARATLFCPFLHKWVQFGDTEMSTICAPLPVSKLCPIVDKRTDYAMALIHM